MTIVTGVLLAGLWLLVVVSGVRATRMRASFWALVPFLVAVSAKFVLGLLPQTVPLLRLRITIDIAELVWVPFYLLFAIGPAVAERKRRRVG